MDTATRSIMEGHFEAAEVLLNHPRTASGLQGNESSLGLLGRELESLSSEKGGPRQRLLKLLVEKCQSALDRFANHVLLVSARTGCLPIVQKLFEVARSDKPIRDCLLQATTDEWGPIGCAGTFGHKDVVEYLCQQGGIEAHLHHRHHNGGNIYHLVARDGNVDVLRVLIRHFPEGVNDTRYHPTPLQLAVGYARSIEAARVLLLEGKADINAGDPFYMPLNCAVCDGNIDMCRMLIVEGKANPWIVVGVTEHPKQPDLKVPVLLETMVLPSSSLQDEQGILKGICALMPLAVSMESLV